MITPRYVRGFSAYNSEMNRRVYAAAGRLTDEARRQDRGAFFRSLHGTLNHLMWGDTMWMSRFAGGDKPVVPIGQSAELFDNFSAMQARRIELDVAIQDWASNVTDEWLAGDLTWYSGLAGREVSAPRILTVIHFFNHQTHHRGQAHALLTAAGEDPGGTDIAFILPPTAWA